MDPDTAKVAKSIGIAQTELNKMKQVLDARGEAITGPTSSPTMNNFLAAAGLLK